MSSHEPEQRGKAVYREAVGVRHVAVVEVQRVLDEEDGVSSDEAGAKSPKLCGLRHARQS